MTGAAFGDITGSIYEWDNIKTKNFDLFQERMFFTDDTVMTMAIAEALINYKTGNGELSELAVKSMQELGENYPDAGYGGRFGDWLKNNNPEPYYSYGNGAAMRVSPCGWAANSIEEAKQFSREVTKVTHNHPEGIKGAEATAVAIYLARQGKDKAEIKKAMQKYYPLENRIDEIRPNYKFDESCQKTVPEAIQCFLESTSFEDTIRNAISLGGDSDTLAAIAGSIAEAYYGVKKTQINFVKNKLDNDLLKILERFEKIFNAVKEIED